MRAGPEQVSTHRRYLQPEPATTSSQSMPPPTSCSLSTLFACRITQLPYHQPPDAVVRCHPSLRRHLDYALPALYPRILELCRRPRLRSSPTSPLPRSLARLLVRVRPRLVAAALCCDPHWWLCFAVGDSRGRSRQRCCCDAHLGLCDVGGCSCSGCVALALAPSALFSHVTYKSTPGSTHLSPPSIRAPPEYRHDSPHVGRR